MEIGEKMQKMFAEFFPVMKKISDYMQSVH